MVYQMQPVQIAPLQLQAVQLPSLLSVPLIREHSFAQFASPAPEVIRTGAFMCALASQEMSH